MKLKRNISLSLLWSATFMLLMSLAVMHHHHLGEICVAIEECTIDGNVNDSHTEHQENEEDGCMVQQMHNFLTNIKHVSFIQHSLTPYVPLVAILPETVSLSNVCGKFCSRQVAVILYSALLTEQGTLRGPPVVVMYNL